MQLLQPQATYKKNRYAPPLSFVKVIFPNWKKTKVQGEGDHAVKTWPTLLTFSFSTIGNIASAHAGQ